MVFNSGISKVLVSLVYGDTAEGVCMTTLSPGAVVAGGAGQGECDESSER